MRLESTIKNSFWGVLYHFVYILLGFISRLVFVRILGVEYYGINGLFTSFLSILSIADMGLGWAIAYNLYKPLSEKDELQISKLMNLFRKVYKYLCGFVILFGLLCMPFLGLLVKTSLSQGMLYLVFTLFIAETAIGYLYAYSSVLLIADQKNYISTMFETGINVVQMTLRIGLLLVTKSYIVYLVSGIFVKLFGNMLRSREVDRQYTFLKVNRSVKTDDLTKRKVFSDAKNIVVNRVCATLATASDNIFIMFFSNITMVGFYSNYVLIFNIVNGFAGQFLNSYQASLGNLYVSESEDRRYLIFKRSIFMSYLVLALSLPGLWLLSDIFIELWMGAEFIIQGWAVKIAILNLVLMLYFEPLNKVVNAAGLFKKDKYFTLIDLAIKFSFSIVLGISYGLAGIFFATTLGLIFSIILRSRYVVKTFFKQSYVEYIRITLKHFLLVIAQILISVILFEQITTNSPILTFGLRLSVTLMSFGLFNYFVFRKTDEYQYLKLIINKVFKLFVH